MKYTLYFLSILVIAASCQKTPQPTTTTADMLQTGRWKVTGGTGTFKKFFSTKDSVSQIMNVLPNCMKDDFFVFSSGFNGAINHNGTTCMPSDPGQQQFSWYLSNNGGSLTILNATGDYDTSNIVGTLAFNQPNLAGTITGFSQSNFTLSYINTFAYPGTDGKPIKDTIFYKLTFQNF